MAQPGNELTELMSMYSAAEPGRARGGIVALTGFEYQIWSHLADYALALTSNQLDAGGRQFADAFEVLSDYTRAADRGTVCVQVKHHLDRRSMALAAAEFAAIERFVVSHPTGGLSGRVTYEVVARSGAESLN
jgi:hypothetical protein